MRTAPRGRTATGAPTRRLLAGGVVVLFVYVVLAAWSGRLSPLARRPVLDGLGPVVAYKWVAPPADLAATNIEPSSGAFTLKIVGDGTIPDVLFTSDQQCTLIVSGGAVPRTGDATAVEVAVDPVDPATLGALPGELAAFGNAYRIQAALAPGQHRVAGFEAQVDAELLYPVTATLHAATHTLLWSRDGRTWTELETAESAAQQQVSATIQGPGYVLVAGVLTPPPATVSPSPGGTGASTVSTVLLIVAGASLLIGIALLIRARRLD